MSRNRNRSSSSSHEITKRDVKDLLDGIKNGSEIEELFMTENCPSMGQIIVGTHGIDLNDVSEAVNFMNYLKNVENYTVDGHFKIKHLKKITGMIGMPSSEGSIHDINEEKSNMKSIRNMKKDLVVKVIPDVSIDDPRNPFVIESLATFLATSVTSDNSVSVYGAFVCNGIGYTIMEKLDGTFTEFRKIMKRKLTMNDAENVVFQVLVSLHAVQSNFRMVHHDLHLDNIMIKKIPKSRKLVYNVNGTEYEIKNRGFIVKLIDFGYATFTFNEKRFHRVDFTEKDMVSTGYGKWDHSYSNSYDIIFFLKRLVSQIPIIRDNLTSQIGSLYVTLISDRAFSEKEDGMNLNKEWTILNRTLRPFGKIPSFSALTAFSKFDTEQVIRIGKFKTSFGSSPSFRSSSRSSSNGRKSSTSLTPGKTPKTPTTPTPRARSKSKTPTPK